jgi:lipopolysaccharide biosynthesis glycosyltransferase
MSPPDSREIVLACAADDGYVQPLAVMLQSVLANLDASRSLAVHIVDGGIERGHRRDLTRSWDPARVVLHFPTPRPQCLAGVPLWGRMPIATYYKLLVPELLPDVSKAIWLDCDLVVTGDLARLWDSDLGDRHALAVNDPGVPFVSSRNGVAAWRELGLRHDTKYFNAGVMVLDLDLWRRDEVPVRALEYLRRYRDTVVFWDQEALNAVLAGRWAELDPRWNHIANLRGSQPGAPEAWIHHFTGTLKPWVYPGAELSHTLYYRYLDQTAWAGWRPQRSVARMVIGSYQSSALRRMLLPAEERLMRLMRTLTRKNAPA